MTIAKPFIFTMPIFNAVYSAVRGIFQTLERPSGDILRDAKSVVRDVPEATHVTAKRNAGKPEHSVMSKEHAARLQDHELERRLFTEVEREDSDMLNRVRAALYKN